MNRIKKLFLVFYTFSFFFFSSFASNPIQDFSEDLALLLRPNPTKEEFFGVTERVANAALTTDSAEFFEAISYFGPARWSFEKYDSSYRVKRLIANPEEAFFLDLMYFFLWCEVKICFYILSDVLDEIGY